ncbi:MAG: AraC family transcriptional regulator [Hyphomonadaceae bacterium]|nr:AraC family transcriptional regulator [Hyphomonadaceae bacterium]
MAPLREALEAFIATRESDGRVFLTPIDGLIVMRHTEPVASGDAQYGLYTPSLCVVAQGAKQITLGEDVFDYDEGAALVVSVEVPAMGRVTRASRAAPYLGMTIGLDIGIMHEVLEQLPSPPRPTSERLGVFVERLSEPMADCVLRLARLLVTPDAMAILHPPLMKELCFHLLTGPNGGEVCKIARAESHTRKIADAIHFIRKNFMRPIRVEDMADAAGMSASSFHEHFRTLTAMSPLQYQKHLRLLEARRLMIVQAASVTEAALHVGYESLSQFSREYARMFGAPPKRDRDAMKALIAQA